MNLLLDTHVLLWAVDEPGKLSDGVRRAFADPATRPFVSLVSVWGIRVKQAVGKLRLGFDPVAAMRVLEAELLGIEPLHVERLRDLPLHHTGPFDRLLVAQALAEPMTLVTADRNLWRHPVLRLW